MLVKYDDGYCIITDDNGKAFELHSSGLVNMTEFDTGGIYAEVSMQLPDWLADGIREAFKNEISKQMDRGA